MSRANGHRTSLYSLYPTATEGRELKPRVKPVSGVLLRAYSLHCPRHRLKGLLLLKPKCERNFLLSVVRSGLSEIWIDCNRITEGLFYYYYSIFVWISISIWHTFPLNFEIFPSNAPRAELSVGRHFPSLCAPLRTKATSVVISGT
jgi:hypothetical protein